MLLVLFAALLAAACGGGDDAGSTGTGAERTTTTSTTTVERSTTSTTAATTQTCTAAADGYRALFPADWFVNDTEAAEPCRFFHPRPVDLDKGIEATSIAVVLRFTSAPFDDITKSTLEDPGGAEIRAQRRETVAGQDALRIGTVATGEGRLPPGTRSVQWFVDFGSRTMTAVTVDAVENVSFGESTLVLDEMMRTLERVTLPSGSDTCSSAGMERRPTPQSGLPAAVARTRSAIVAAAVACDYERLEKLALAGSRGFTYSFGASGNPGGHWLRQERSERGPKPLRFLVGLLERPYRLVEHEHRGFTEYVWPSAFAYDDWDSVPAPDREALKPLYTEKDFAGFARFGGYVGYRIGITPKGDWTFFVAGD